MRILLTISLLLTISKAVLASPPYSGTVYIDPDWIIESDLTTYSNLTYDGIQNVLMYDRRIPAWERSDAHVWIISYSDSTSINAQVNAEFDKQTSKTIAEKWGRAVGRLPKTLRRDVDELWIHDGDELMGGGNRSILIHVGHSDMNYSRGWAEEELLHEAVHTSLDSYYKNSEEWLSAQQSDGEYISDYARDYPAREDLAESFGPYMAIRILTDRVKALDEQKILSAMPARIDFLNSLSLEWSPWSEPSSSLEDKRIFPATICKASNPATSIQLQSRESGLTNTKTDTNISVTCPINYDANRKLVYNCPNSCCPASEFPDDAVCAQVLTTVERDTTTEALNFTLKASNLDSNSKALSCELHEYIGEALNDSLSSQTTLSGGGIGTINWNNWRATNNLTKYTITCDLPPQAAITSIETRVVY